MGTFLWQSCFLCVIFTTVFLPGRSEEGTAKRQLYLGPSDVLLPESNSDFPAPIVSPSGVVPAAGAVPAALAIAPSPLIGPAPAILPSDAIKEKNRATPMEDQGKAKRFDLPFSPDPIPSSWSSALTQDNTFPQNQLPEGQTAAGFNSNQINPVQTLPIVPNEMYEDVTQHRDQLNPASLTFQFLQGMYSSHSPKSLANKMEYYEPNDGEQGAQPFLDSTYADTGPSKEDLKKIQPLLDHENDIADAIIKDTWKEDSVLSTSRQAVSEGLTTSHQLAKVHWKNKPSFVDKPVQQPSINNNINDGDEGNQRLTQGLSPINDHGNLPQDDKLQESQPSSPDATNLTTNEKEQTTTLGEVVKVLSPLNTSLDQENLPKKQRQKFPSLSSTTNSTFVGNDLKNKSVDAKSSSIEWITDATLSKSNGSLEKSNLLNSQTKKPYTAAEYLQTLYPQLSVFKATLGKERQRNGSLRSLTSSAQLLDNGNKPTATPLKEDIKDALRNMRNAKFDQDKYTASSRNKAENELTDSLQRANSMLGERSAIKQYNNAPRFIKSSKMSLPRLKKITKEVPGYRYLTASGAKLLPGHIFSPLGTAFGDTFQGPSTSPAGASPSTTAIPPTAEQQRRFPPLVPTQAGQILSQTQSHAKEPTTPAVIVPTQSGMIPSSTNASEENKVILAPTVSDNNPTEARIAPTRPTKLAVIKPAQVPTQSGFIPAWSLAENTTSPTQATLLPTQIGFIPSGKQKEKIWTGIPENNSERKDVKPVISKQGLFSSWRRGSAKVHHEESGRRHLHERPKGRGRKETFSHFVQKRVEDQPPAHKMQRRQVLLPVPFLQTNENLQQLGQSLLPVQQSGQSLIPDLSQMQQLQAAQQFLPRTQQLQGLLPQLVQFPQTIDSMSLLGLTPDLRSQLPLQPALNQPIPQTLLTPQQGQNQGLPLSSLPGDLNQLSNTLGFTPYQHISPQQLSTNNNQAEASPLTVNVPMEAPKKIPSFVTASQVYRDFEDVNSRSNFADDLVRGQVSRGDVPRNQGYVPYDDFPNEPKYDRFAYENDKKMWGMDNDVPEDEDEGNLRSPPRKHRKNDYSRENDDDDSIPNPNDLDNDQSPTNLRYSTGGRRRHYRPRSHHRHHWVNENDLTGVNEKGIIGHNDEEGDELEDDEGLHAAGETTENPTKEDRLETSLKHRHRSRHHRPSFDQDSTESDQSKNGASSDDEESDQSDDSPKSSQSDPRQSDETEQDRELEAIETQRQEENPRGNRANEDKNEKHDELTDGLEEATSEESPVVSLPLPKPVTLPNEDKLKEEIFKKLSRGAIMHLTFDQQPAKSERRIVSDESGNKNDAGLANGAEISNRTMGSCGRVAVLKRGEVVYKAEHFSRKPTKAASIAMWVKSSKPGLVRWFDVGDAKTKSSRFKHNNGKLVKVPKNQWIHLAGTFDSNDGIARVYVNGKLISERIGKKNQGLPDDFTATGIGQKFGDKFISFLDDVFMFDRVLAPAEVRMLYRKCEFNRMVLHFGFQNVNTTTHQLMDQSGLENNATIDSGAHILASGCDKCGACLDASSDKMPGVYLDGRKFHHKPTSAISVSSWISLNRTKGRHSIFQAVSDKNDEWHDIYNLDVVNGKLHWKHKNENKDIIFNVKTQDVVIPEGLWSHVTATYNSDSGDAKLYVNGILKASLNNANKSKLNVAWGRVSIGGHLPDARNFAGLLDEFFIYNWELNPSEVRFVLKYCADKPKLVSFTVRVPLFKRQRVQQVQHAPQVMKYL